MHSNGRYILQFVFSCALYFYPRTVSNRSPNCQSHQRKFNLISYEYLIFMGDVHMPIQRLRASLRIYLSFMCLG
jgi:hypothetical protein